MTPEEELAKLNRLIKQYESVYRTTADGGQKDRVGRELAGLKGYRDKLLSVSVIDQKAAEERPPAENDELASWPVLSRLDAEEEDVFDGDPEVRRILLYANHFEKEFLPLLVEARLKLDFKYSLERDQFYAQVQDLLSRAKDFIDAHRRIAEGALPKDMGMEMRKRNFKIKRLLGVEEARLFRKALRFSQDLIEDARADGVKCLNAEDPIEFDTIEGKRLLAGRTVVHGLEEMRDLATEALDFLNIPDIETQET
jgi:hypothetical protein